ncbi:hypothetical protein CATYP_06415 [Corynebacterium atypicum]|uniref:Release factor glutamine methyltransferase n=1 Tax=Corynebacterium atypicum TaxID=191610 RepID=A0ABN4DGK6_9CORY|nr:peptide chain release factor N(5)-glutamine methyltransferase [Corynebacterium atypicum]AIG64302.1 hypothetical protein CATYP_06415 [Corynebacterium atypicum]
MPETVREALAQATRRLGAAGIDSPHVDARILAAHFLGCAPLEVFVHASQPVPEGFAEAVARRERREPLQWITGSAAFGPLELAVGPGVFIPRPETEVLADWAVRTLQASGTSSPVVVDLCAGCAAMALFIAHELPDASVHAVELSESAVEWARRNVGALGLNVELHEADATDPGLLAQLAGKVDLVVANPPYVPDAAPVAPEVDFDPSLAIFGGPDGLGIVRGIVGTAGRLVRPGGWFGFEHDDAAAEPALEILAASGLFGNVRSLRDLAGIERFTLGARL